ncbi:MAG: hypothetical protein H6R43_204 [Nitrospirae bacterium]|nr:hypothetical protein [Nitrospirota bacterium]
MPARALLSITESIADKVIPAKSFNRVLLLCGSLYDLVLKISVVPDYLN